MEEEEDLEEDLEEDDDILGGREEVFNNLNAFRPKNNFNKSLETYNLFPPMFS